jgi:hypothetical protein
MKQESRAKPSNIAIAEMQGRISALWDRSKVSPEQTRQERLEFHYGLTVPAYQRLLAKQGGVCAICGEASRGSKTVAALFVDHCHATGVVRGLLCGSCNSMIGFAQDSAERLAKGITYLQNTLVEAQGQTAELLAEINGVNYDRFG